MGHVIPAPGNGQTFLGPDHRVRAWQRLGNEQFDVIVIGGGVVGAGAALDAATRGLKVALVEARDFASGTSSRSSKMFHGGLRYLEQLEFGLVREALHERELSLTTLAPHLVKPLPFLFPLTNRGWERPYIAAGIFLYDQLGGAKSVPAQKHLTRSGALRLSPGLKRSSLIGGIRYYDTVVDDARHTMTVARTAAHYSAVVRTSTQVVALLREGDRVTGVRVRDSENGEVTEVRGHVVVNATGVWTDEIQALSKQRGRFRVRASKGVHIVVPRDRIVSEVAIILRTEKSVLFVIPWGTHWIIGTTDTDWHLDLAHPAATKADIDYILGHVNKVLATPLTHDDIDGVYAGLRPLLAGESEETSKLSREHAVAVPAPGLVAIAGGKYTTYRVMAEDAIDAAAEFIPTRVAPSITERVPLMGADGYFALINQTQSVGAHYGLHPYRVRHLLDRYGSLIGEVLKLASDLAAVRPDLLEPITDAPVYLKVEAAYAAAAEGALHLEDILARRMRISIEYPHRGVDCAREVAEVVAPLLGWSAEDVDREVDTYLARVEAEVLSQTQPDDESADALRAAAPEARAEILEPVPLK
ncbi:MULTISPECIES: glycerol-3-phosphate dehydrogenase/oxidase [Mycolicibacterium]|uniref:Glycerol-3-phosphate dehydrogenase n=1 Tax=Mycolicibacterium vanbaalenii (strain DSM 7251 / JCM 13017 / BCRC 16820 / KCTC 9966 / NRRL B-24157 / PYR-1) TaxID=350058 RepID=A1T5J9_MYCVP|nr:MULTISPECIES: glycerol-3-phosphate dehydrogenase/oxidase [Mycolicibacterium]ABM12449.1 FAD dependent oxidoreductase [Mycolicibacterium vanbaalenii PYR-1]MCV7128452.1 glycerol-3-phosphate dehydrogenase/oxidase [Mycolicibacterium vanbaalenii PYR-1]MDW5611029.1 glycerol-3-phosphate dehydrogenase/oxidase [Mycolicibacterium sp. D5.8-2]PQP48766.1 glycerol-3-phosphate dehydrogenase/oxidase [Mycolicibacterium austroafricanum]QRZ08273.1 glycerol-3-phosphate dehydrogenase/oxidase [Mycolicibacterium a